MPQPNPNKFHWYCMTFNYVNADGHGFCNAYEGFTDKYVLSKPIIDACKHHAKPDCDPNTMVLTACIYLGYMTQNEFVTITAEHTP